jgi:uncharacterized repeat protein (TIGR01451 family)
MIGTKLSRSRRRPAPIRRRPVATDLPWELEWLEDRLLLAAAVSGVSSGTSSTVDNTPPTSTVPQLTLGLSMTGTPAGITNPPDLTIGETGIEELVAPIPQGTIPDAQLTLSLPEGLALANLDTMSDGPGVSFSAGSAADVVSAGTIAPDGRSATLNFGTITSAYSTSTGAPIGVIIFYFEVVALNVASNQEGTVATTTATLSYPGGSATATSAATIVTPDLNVSMAVDKPTAQPGDTVQYTIVLGHGAPSGADAFGIALADILPAGAAYVPGTLKVVAGRAPDNLGVTGGTISARYDAFPLGSTSTLTFNATLDRGLAAGQTVNNSVDVRYATLPGDATAAQSPYNDASTGRTGSAEDPGGAANDLVGSAVAPVAVVASSLAGTVYVDTNNDGSQEPGEPGIAGVTVALKGVDDQGHAVSSVTTTSNDGTYQFTGLRAGNYALSETPPANRLDGQDTVGSLGGSNATADRLSAIVVGPGVQGSGYNFAALPTAALGLNAAIDDGRPNVGQNVTFTLKLLNAGPDDASGVAVAAGLPAGLNLVSAVASTGTYDAEKGVWTVAALPGGSVATLKITGTVNSPDPQTLRGTITASDQQNSASGSNSASATETPQRSDVVVSTTVSDPHPNLGEAITLSTKVVNNGPDAASNVTLQSLLPPGLVLLSATPSQGSYDATTGRWSVGPLPNGAVATLLVQARVGTPADQRVSSAITAADQYNPDPAHTQSSVLERIQKADVYLTATVSDPTPAVGQTVTYTVEVGNIGPDAATHLVVKAHLPSGMTLGTATANQGTYDPATGTWVLGTLASGVDPTLTITGEVMSADVETLSASVAGVDQFDPNALNNAQSAAVTPQAAVVTPSIVIAPPVFAPVIGTLVQTAPTSSGSSSSSTGAPSGPTAQGAQLTASGGRGQSGRPGTQHGARVSHAHPHPHPAHHATPHAPGPAAPVIPIIPGLVVPPLPVAAAGGAAARNNVAPGAAAAIAGGLPAEQVKSGSSAVPIGSPTPVQSLSASLAPNDTGAVGTTMKVITIVQAQRIWSRGQRSHHHGSRRRFR